MASQQQTTQFNSEKLAELIVFFASESANDRLFGSTKLNKLLFLADFLSYGYRGRSITGATYVHQKRGPTPKPDQFLNVRQGLIEEGRLELVQEETYFGQRKRPVAKSYPDLGLFDKVELDIAYEAIESLKHMGNVDSENWSHKFVGWQYTSEGDVIPYQSVYLWQKVPTTADDLRWAGEVARHIGVGTPVYAG